MKRKHTVIIALVLTLVLLCVYGIYSIYDNYRFGLELYNAACTMSGQSRLLADSIDFLEEEFERAANDPAYKVRTSSFDSAILSVHLGFGYDDMPLREDVRLAYIDRFEDLLSRSRSDESLKDLFTDNEEMTVLKTRLRILTESLVDFRDRYDQMSVLERIFTSWKAERETLSNTAKIA